MDGDLFPVETKIGYPGVTATGVEPAAIETAKSYPTNDNPAANYPLVIDETEDNAKLNMFQYWGNLAPWYSVPSSFYGLDKASPLVPETCDITQVHLLYRHGARYPTSGANPSKFATKLQSAVGQGGFTSWGELDFLNKWTYKLGAELLTPFGRLQNFELGVAARQQYGSLLNNFTEQGTLPVFRTQSQDRMVKTANNFAAGFFGVPEYLDQVNSESGRPYMRVLLIYPGTVEIVIETAGLNNTGAPYEICTNSNVASRGSIGSTAATTFANNAFNSTISRLQGQIKGVNITSTDIIAMLQLCSYETDALGYSEFCKLFTEEDFRNYE